MKKIKYITFSLIAFCALLTVAYAYSIKNFRFTQLGQRAEAVEDLPKGLYYTYANLQNNDVDATVGMSLAKKNWYGGFDHLDRCNNSTYGRYSTFCNYNEQPKGTYKGTIVFNTSNDGKQLNGTFYLTNY